MKLRFRLQGWFWNQSPLFLPPLRRLRQLASQWLYRWRGRRRSLPPRLLPGVARGPAKALEPPLIAVHTTAEANVVAIDRFLADQTETSWTTDSEASERASFCLILTREPAPLPATWLESQLLAMIVEDLDWTLSGWAAPAADPYSPAADVHGAESIPCPGLMRLPSPERRGRLAILGRAVPHVTAEEQLDGQHELAVASDAVRSGPHFLRSDVGPGRLVRQPLRSLEGALAKLPVEDGPPTVLYLLPFLAVGGAESLLFDLMEGLADRYRQLVVTVEPHRAELGQTVDEARRLTPHVYTLGDWLSRPAHPDALRHLMRRYQAEVLVSWNGTVFFYDEAPKLRNSHPNLRIVNQLFNHRGGWIEHYGSRLVRSVDLHVAVNRPIGEALCKERGVPEERRAVIHHGVKLPPEISDDQRTERQRQARLDLGLPQDAVIAGTFIRMHSQKRPLDILRLARQAHDRGPEELHFLLVGGGPMDTEIDAEIARHPCPNLTRLSMRRDIDRLYDAVDLCLLTSAFEGLPVFLLDGLARGIPCIATAVGDVPLLLQDGGGILIESPGDLEAMARALTELAAPERRAAEGKIGRETVARRFGVDGYIQAFERAFFPGK